MPSEQQETNWLSDLLTTARASRWCVRPACTTCGSLEFRRHLRARVRTERIEGLQALRESEVMAFREGVRLVLMDTAILPSATDLVTDLAGTPAGAEFAAMRRHAEQRRKAAEERDRLLMEAPTRREAACQARAVEHAVRLAGKATRDAALREERTRLGRMAIPERLAALSSAGYPWSLDAIGFDTLNAGFAPGARLSESDHRLAKLLIGRRRGAWSKWLKRVAPL